MRCRKTTWGIFLFLLLFLIPINCSAYKYAPRSSGLILDSALNVIGVNVDSPAYIAGIRPGDRINGVKDEKGNEIPSEDISHFLYEAKEAYTINVNDKNIKLENERISKRGSNGLFLVQGTKEEVFKRLYNTLAFNPELSTFLSIKNADTNLLYITTYAKVDKKEAHDVKHHILNSDRGLSIVDVTINGTFAVGEQNGYTLLKENLNHDVTFSSVFAGNHTMACPSSGMLEREVIEGMYGMKISHTI